MDSENPWLLHAAHGSDRPHTYSLPRLPREYYQGDAVVHWTLTVFDRAKGWLTEMFHARFRELMLHVAAREGLWCPVYCLMPDHLHLVWMGLRLKSDQLKGMSFLRTHLEPLLAPAKFQPQAHDHVLRAPQRLRNAFAEACRYDLNNPVRARLVAKPDGWRFLRCRGSGLPAITPARSGLLAEVLEATCKSSRN